MDSRKTNLQSRVLLFLLAALLGITWGAPVNCTAKVAILNELRPFDNITVGFTFTIKSKNQILYQYARKNKSLGLINCSQQTGGDCTAESEGSICPWKYQLNYDPKRIPQYTLTAESQSQSKTFIDENLVQYDCKPIYMMQNVLRVTCEADNTDPKWELVQEKVTVGFIGIAATS